MACFFNPISASDFVAKQKYFRSLKVLPLNNNRTIIAVAAVTVVLDFMVPNTEISVLCKLSNLIFTKFFYPHFINEKTEA